ncbi:hypothetical protein K458DRAFT_411755 [Lentithecium fluviatile CBS 122367]|uniref:Uncharacterized protein n=1 Tax=Lentithecium fluviatile CBS 122367 TaxID=1168545 RepID=A0A6G1JNG6_9PLEO|nr:hypothetical protein K458DRAFT_411755 [Lentithecium fluviatile CBS 122367]
MTKTGSEEYLISPPPGRRLRWYHQTDPLLILGGSLAIIIGSIWLADSFRISEETAERSNFFSLLTFGIASAAAWTCTTRAIFHVASMEAAGFAKCGVQQRDLSLMLEMRAPNSAWLHWRKRMWRSSAYAIVCFALYVAVGVLYRFAFSTKEHVTVAGGRQCSYALMGDICGKHDLFGFYGSLIDQGARWPTYAAPSLPFIQASPGDWDVQAAWHGETFAADTEPKTWGWLKAWHVLGITMLDETDSDDWVGEEFSYFLNGTDSLRVADHPVCGPMLKGATTNGTKGGDPISREYWFALAVGEMKTTYERIPRNVNDPDYSMPPSNFSIVSGTPLLSSDGCPMSIEREAYDTLVDYAQSGVFSPFMELDFSFLSDYYGYTAGDAQSKWSFLADKRTVFAILLSILQHNQTYISQSDREQLIAKDLLRQELINPENDWCECSYSPGLEYSKNNSVTIYAFPRTQFFASLLAIVWGILLLGAAYPFRKLVIRGTLDQYMSFGGDIGCEGMAGASTGKFSATSEALWQLVEAQQENGARKVGLVEVPMMLKEGNTVKLKPGRMYV